MSWYITWDRTFIIVFSADDICSDSCGDKTPFSSEIHLTTRTGRPRKDSQKIILSTRQSPGPKFVSSTRSSCSHPNFLLIHHLQALLFQIITILIEPKLLYPLTVVHWSKALTQHISWPHMVRKIETTLHNLGNTKTTHGHHLVQLRDHLAPLGNCMVNT